MIIINKYGYKLELIGEVEKLNNEVIEMLKEYDDTIYFNNSNCKYWMFDFKLKDIWFSSENIDLVNKEITFKVFQ